MNFQQFFDSIASHYEERIIPAFEPFAHDLVTWIAPSPQTSVLDIGTGTGIAARLIAPHVQQVVAMDFAPTMTQVARETTAHLSNLTVIQGDAHALPFASDSVDLVMAAFGLNATNPRKSFAQAYRVLQPGGWLMFQEWAAIHEFDRRIVEALEVYAVFDEDAPPELIQIRDFLEEDRAWYHFLQTIDDYQDELSAAGFVDLDVQEYQPVQVRLSINDFLRYKLAWPSRIAELAAMDDSARADCLDRMRELLQAFADADGTLTYDPFLFRVRAHCPEN